MRSVLSPSLNRTGKWERYPPIEEIPRLLRGRDLGCWCPPDMPCDVLLEIARTDLRSIDLMSQAEAAALLNISVPSVKRAAAVRS